VEYASPQSIARRAAIHRRLPVLFRRFSDLSDSQVNEVRHALLLDLRVLVSVTKLNPNIIAKMSRVRYADSLNPALIQPIIDVAVRFKIIDASVKAQKMLYQR
jgi:hypothetical protein